jgi:hypothetical protein
MGAIQWIHFWGIHFSWCLNISFWGLRGLEHLSILATNTLYVRFEVFTAVTMKNGVFWVITPWGSCNNPEDTILHSYVDHLLISPTVIATTRVVSSKAGAYICSKTAKMTIKTPFTLAFKAESWCASVYRCGVGWILSANKTQEIN